MNNLQTLCNLAKPFNIILASKSPRRDELLKLLDIDFKVIANFQVSEEFSAEMDPYVIPEMLSIKKSEGYPFPISNNDIIITADTRVYCNNKILGKPANIKEAIEMLQELSGKAHKVITGVTIRDSNNRDSFTNITTVYFKELTKDEIEYYVIKYKPLDKAGAYGVQEWIGATSICKVEGSFYNVVGLPIQQLSDRLKEFILQKQTI